MKRFEIWQEVPDVSDIAGKDMPQISLDAQAKFEKLMEDEQLHEVKKEVVQNRAKEFNFSNALDKFENLFQSDTVFKIESIDEIMEDENSTVVDKHNKLHECNLEYKIDEDIYETDDMGITYKKNGEMLPNMEYTVNGNKYRTDENGNKVSCDAVLEIHEEGKRNVIEQRESGGKDRKEGDQGGHIIARILGGAEGEENLVPMRGTINQGDYRKMELEIKKALEKGSQVHIHIDLEYNGTSSRPTKIKATYMIDGKKTDIVFDNEENSTELLDALDTKLLDEDFAHLQEEIDDMKEDGCPASITSVKTEYDENGTAMKMIVGVLDESTGIKSYKVYDVR